MVLVPLGQSGLGRLKFRVPVEYAVKRDKVAQKLPEFVRRGQRRTMQN